MESSNMKNMVILKNIPSNMVEEAIIIFKETQKIKEREFADKNKVNHIEKQSKSKEYILKEAEMLVTDYVRKLENKKIIDKKEKYKSLKIYSIITTVLLVISLIINFI